MPASEPSGLTPLQNAVYLLKQAQARLAAYEYAQAEPIAVVGMGCRFPGDADGPEAFWRLLSQGVDAVREVPRERWNIDDYYDPDPAAPGKMNTRWGGFLQGVDEFDAEFFGISPREAVRVDPQHRLLLEVSWEALENAGIVAGNIAQTKTGVYVGVIGSDYALLQARDLADVGRFLRHRQQSCHPGQSAFLRLEPQRPQRHARHGLLVVAGDRTPGLPESAAARDRPGPGGRREPDPQSRDDRHADQGPHDVAGRALQHVRRLGQRLRPRRGLRRGRAQAAQRCRGRPRSHPGADPRQRGQPRRAEQRAVGAQRAGAGGGDPGRAARGRIGTAADRLH